MTLPRLTSDTARDIISQTIYITASVLHPYSLPRLWHYTNPLLTYCNTLLVDFMTHLQSNVEGNVHSVVPGASAIRPGRDISTQHASDRGKASTKWNQFPAEGAQWLQICYICDLHPATVQVITTMLRTMTKHAHTENFSCQLHEQDHPDPQN